MIEYTRRLGIVTAAALVFLVLFAGWTRSSSDYAVVASGTAFVSLDREDWGRHNEAPQQLLSFLPDPQMKGSLPLRCSLAISVSIAADGENEAASIANLAEIPGTTKRRRDLNARHAYSARVYVERVNVEKGGQAIVGPVSHGVRGGGDDDESDR